MPLPLPPVSPLPGGNQYGGQPINPFAGPGPVRPMLTKAALPALPPSAFPGTMRNIQFNPINPLVDKPVSSPTKPPLTGSKIDFYDAARKTVSGGPTQIGTNASNQQTVGTTQGQIFDRRNTPTLTDVSLNPNIFVNPANTGATLGGLAGGGVFGNISDIRSKENIQPIEEGTAEKAQQRVTQATKQFPTSYKNPIEAGFNLGQMIRGRMDQPAAGEATAQFHPLPGGPVPMMPPDAQASFEQPISPMTGAGFNRLGNDSPFAMQRTVNLPFGTMSPNDLRDKSDEYVLSDANAKQQAFMAGQQSMQNAMQMPQNMGSYATPPPQAQALGYGGVQNPSQPAQALGYGGMQAQPTSAPQPRPPMNPMTMQRSLGRPGMVSSPREAKTDIRPVNAMIAPQDYQAAWQGVSMEDSARPQTAAQEYSFSNSRPIKPGANLDKPYFVPPPPPGVDLRPAQGYSYQYKDPQAPGAKPGTQFGPMAQDLEKTPAGKSVVSTNPDTGMKQVDTSRLTMVNTAAISEQQRKLEELTALLDEAYARSANDTSSRYGRFQR